MGDLGEVCLSLPPLPFRLQTRLPTVIDSRWVNIITSAPRVDSRIAWRECTLTYTPKRKTSNVLLFMAVSGSGQAEKHARSFGASRHTKSAAHGA